MTSQHQNADAAALRTAVVVPCFREKDHVLAVLERVPESVSTIILVDDACPQGTGDFVSSESTDPRVRVLKHEQNLGVGAAMRTGYKAALAEDVDIVVKLDGDGQMDGADIPRLIRPIVEDTADYTKGNRFYRLRGLEAMPVVRLVGNVVLSFVSKLSSGYWQLFDPNNGFTAIDARILALVPLDDVDDGYFFESDMLFRLNTLRAVVVDVPMQAQYGAEESSLEVTRATGRFACRHAVNFFKRLVYNYFLRGFSVASLEWILGPLALLFGVVFGISEWIQSVHSGVAATAGTVMLASLPTIVGLQMLLSAIHFDIGNEPTIPLRRLLGGESVFSPGARDQSA